MLWGLFLSLYLSLFPCSGSLSTCVSHLTSPPTWSHHDTSFWTHSLALHFLQLTFAFLRPRGASFLYFWDESEVFKKYILSNIYLVCVWNRKKAHVSFVSHTAESLLHDLPAFFPCRNGSFCYIHTHTDTHTQFQNWDLNILISKYWSPIYKHRIQAWLKKKPYLFCHSSPAPSPWAPICSTLVNIC